MAKFRFQDLEIWKEAINLARVFFGIARRLDEMKYWRFADQLRGVGLSMPNNISESNGTLMKGEQRQLLRVAKRECFEGANMWVLLQLENIITQDEFDPIFERLSILARRIQAYSDSL